MTGHEYYVKITLIKARHVWLYDTWEGPEYNPLANNASSINENVLKQIEQGGSVMWPINSCQAVPSYVELDPLSDNTASLAIIVLKSYEPKKF